MVFFYNDLLERIYKLSNLKDSPEYEKFKLYQSNIEECIQEFVNIISQSNHHGESDSSFNSSSEDESLLEEISQ
jgi:uncharacterized protein YaaR (DUF327 family)